MGSVGDVEFGEDVGEVGFDGACAHEELLADGSVGHGGTFNGSAPSMAASVWSIGEFRARGPEFFTGLNAIGRGLMAAP